MIFFNPWASQEELTVLFLVFKQDSKYKCGEILSGKGT
jgi:hypothetical protein